MKGCVGARPLSVIVPLGCVQEVGFVRVIVDMLGTGFTVTRTVAATDVQLLTVCVTEYNSVPVDVGVTLTTAPVALDKPLPVQRNVAPATPLAVNEIGCPRQTVSEGATAIVGASTATEVSVVASGALMQPFSVTVMLV